MVVDGSNAILTRLGDNAALTGALRLLVDDPERRRQMGRAGWDWMRSAHRSPRPATARPPNTITTSG
jgi:glycosyltransferase involved in cell wall biosynthesis